MAEAIFPIIGVIVGALMTFLTTHFAEKSKWRREEPDRDANRAIQRELENQRLLSAHRRERIAPLMKRLDDLATTIHFTSILDNPSIATLPKEGREPLEKLAQSSKLKATTMLSDLSVITDIKIRNRVTYVALVMMTEGESKKMLLGALKFASTVDALEDAYRALEEYVVAGAAT